MERVTGELSSTLADRYDLVQIIGSGGMSNVWRARDRALDRLVAVKVLTRGTAGDPSLQKRFEREARHIASMAHPNIVEVYDFGSDGNLTFLVMEHLDGQSLDEILRSDKVLSVAMTHRLAVQALSALEHAHDRGIIHRDIKPANILVSTDGTVKVADFGIAKSSRETTELTVQGSFVGTATYASPEQLMGRPVGRTSDLYSLGCVLYQCLVGRPPFAPDDVEKLILQHRFADAQPIRSVRTDTPPTLASAIEVALAKDSADRFATAAQMRASIAQKVEPEGELTIGPISISPTSQSLAPTEVAPGNDTAIGLSAPLAPVREGAVGRPRRRSPAGISKRHRGMVAIAVVAALIVVSAALVWSDGRSTRSPALPWPTAIPSGGFLQPGESVHSSNGRFRLSMQADGNLVVYVENRGTPVWQAATSGNFGSYAVMQADGDFVVYPKGRSAPAPGQPTPALWSSGTFGHPDAHAELQNDGLMVVRASNGSILWRSDAAPAATSPSIGG